MHRMHSRSKPLACPNVASPEKVSIVSKQHVRLGQKHYACRQSRAAAVLLTDLFLNSQRLRLSTQAVLLALESRVMWRHCNCCNAHIVASLRRFASRCFCDCQRLRLSTQVVLMALESRVTRKHHNRCNARFAHACLVAPLPGAGYRVPGAESRVPGAGCWMPGVKCQGCRDVRCLVIRLSRCRVARCRV